MANLTIDSVKARTFDAIVIGSGMSGGWAAKELTEKGLKTPMVERGPNVEHLRDYPTTNLMPWELPYDVQQANPIASRCYVFREDAKTSRSPTWPSRPAPWAS